MKKVKFHSDFQLTPEDEVSSKRVVSKFFIPEKREQQPQKEIIMNSKKSTSVLGSYGPIIIGLLLIFLIFGMDFIPWVMGSLEQLINIF